MGNWRIIMVLILSCVACLLFCFGDKLLGLWCLCGAILTYLVEIWIKLDNNIKKK